ncbi:MAG: serine hydrolase [Lachnospiraceae bacterium]
MKKWKQLFSISLAASLALSSIAMAEITVPPIPTGETTQSGQTSGPSAGQTSGPSVGQETTGTSEPAETTNTAAANLEEPVVAAEGAVLMDAATGKVLYGKNQDQQFYPASITKVMTALLVLENCNLNDVVTFSASATTNMESGSVSLGIVEGDQLTVEQCLYGLLLKSANEIGNGLAEHVSGSVSAFADKMNARARELGCQNTNFANPHGLNNSTHKTTPYDMALILRAALQNETFRKIDTTVSYNFPATKNAAARTITMGHKMMYPTDSRYYEGIIGGKTGYTSLAGNTLVTGVERNGVRLIAVVMKSNSTHYTDTIAMLNYGFENYETLTGSSSSSGTGQTGTATSGWTQDSQGWKYKKADGSMAAEEWITDNNLNYWIDSNGYMAIGWRQFAGGIWYYFKPAGYMARECWIQDEGDWFYLGADGKLLQNVTTPDGYQVDEHGIWRG